MFAYPSTPAVTFERSRVASNEYPPETSNQLVDYYHFSLQRAANDDPGRGALRAGRGRLDARALGGGAREGTVGSTVGLGKGTVADELSIFDRVTVNL